MSLDLGQLVIELVGDYSQLQEDIEDARRQAVTQAKALEKDFNKNFKLVPAVDDSQLTDLNEHLDLKVTHLKQVINFYKTNPIKVNVDTSDLDDLDSALKGVKNKTVEVKVNTSSSSGGGNRVGSSQNAPSSGDKEIVRSIRSLEKTVSESGKKSFTEGISEGITAEIGSAIGKNLLSGFKKNLGVDVGGMTQSFTRAVSKPLAKVNPKSIQEFEDKIVEALEESFVFKNEEQAKVKFKEAFQPIADEIKEIALTAAGEVVKVGVQPLRIRKRVLLAQSMQQAQEMSESIKVPDNDKIRNAKSIALITGGIDYQKGGANTFFAENLVKRVLPGAYSVPVTNPYSNDAGNLGFIHQQTKGLVKELMGGDGNPIPLDMLLHTNIEKGYNPDSVKMAAEAMAYRKAHPDKPLILGGTSGGSYVVEEAMGILERAGIKNVKGLGITAPINNLMTVAKPENYQSNVGEFDPLNVAMFGGRNVEDKNHPIYKETLLSKELPTNVMLPGLFQESELMKLIPKAGKGHALLPFLAKPEFQQNIQEFLGDSIDPISESLSGMRGEPNLHFYRKQNDERPTIARTLAAAFGDPKTLKQIQENNFNGAEGYTFAVPQKPEWRRDNDFKSMMGNLPKAKGIAKDIRPEYDSYVDFLNEMSNGLEKFLDSGGKARQSLLSSLDKAVEMYPELKAVQDRVMSTLSEQGRLLELQKIPASKDERSSREKYQDSARLARINAQFPKGQQYLKDKRNAALDAALPDSAKTALATAREIAEAFNKGYKDLQNLVEQSKKDPSLTPMAAGLAKELRESAVSAKARIGEIAKGVGNDSEFGTRLGSQLAQTKGQVGSVEKKTGQLMAKNKITIPSQVVSSAVKEAQQAGQDIAQGFSQGMKTQLTKLQSSSEELAKIPIEVVKEELDIHSPSKVMEQLGKWAAEGFITGFEALEGLQLPEFFKDILSEAKEMFSGFTSGAMSVDKFAEGFSKLSKFAKIALVSLAGIAAIKTFGSTILEFGKQSLDVATNFEQLDRRVRFSSGSGGDGDKNVSFIRGEARRFNTPIDETLDNSAQFLQATKGTQLEGDPSRQIISGLTQASAVYGQNKEQQRQTFQEFARMASEASVGVTQLQQQLGEGMPNAAEVAARAFNTTTQSLNNLAKTGRLLPEELLPKWVEELQAETSTGVAEASGSSIGMINKFSNAISELEESVGKALLPFRNFTLDKLADGINFLVKNGEIIGVTFASVLAILTEPVWSIIGVVIKGITLDWIEMAATGQISFATLSAAAVGFTETLATMVAGFAPIFLTIGGLTLAYKALKYAFSDSTGDVGKQVDEQQKLIDAYKKRQEAQQNAESANRQSVPKPQPNGFFGGVVNISDIQKREPDIGNIFQKINTNKTLYDLFKRIKQSREQTRFDISSVGENPETLKSMQETSGIDAQLESVRMARRTFIENAPDNAELQRVFNQQESALLKQRQVAVAPSAQAKQMIDSQIENIKSQIDYLNKFKESNPLNADQTHDVDTAIQNLTKDLGDAYKEQDKLRKSVKDTLTELHLFENAWQDIGAIFEDVRRDLDKMQTIFETNIGKKEMLAAISPGSADFTKGMEAQNILAQKIASNLQEIKQKSVQLQSQNIGMVLGNSDLNADSGLADVRKQEARAPEGTKEKTILKSYGDLKELEIATTDLQKQLTEQGVATTRQVYDSNRSVADWLESIQREGQELSLTFKESLRELKLDTAKSKLKSALTGFQDNFMGSFVDSLISMIDALNEPIKEAAQAQSQILQSRNKYQDLIKQSIEMQRALPQQYIGNVAESNAEAQVINSNIKREGYSLSQSVGSRILPVNSYDDLTKHHPSSGVQSGRDYDAINGKLEEVRKSGNSELVKKDLILRNANGSTNVTEPSPATGYARVNQAWGGVAIYSQKVGGQMLGQILHMKDILVKTGDMVRYGQAIGTQSNVHPRGQEEGMGVHTHAELPVGQWHQFVKDLQTGVFNSSAVNNERTKEAGWMRTIASTYGNADNTNGTDTASGRKFNQNELTAAINENLKKNLGIKWGDKVEAVNPANNKSVVVTITDSGPYEKKNGRYIPHSTRGFDLSTAAAKEIGLSLGEINFRVLGKNPAMFQGMQQGTSSPVIDNKLVQNLRTPVAYGAGPAPFTNNGQLGIIAGAKQAADNLQKQNEQTLLRLRTGASADFAKREADLIKSKAGFQLRDSTRDMNEEVIKYQRTREDQADSVGYITPRRELNIKVRSLQRGFNDADLELTKSEERLEATIGTAEASLAALQQLAPELPKGFDLKDAVGKIEGVLASAKLALGKVSGLLNSQSIPARAQINDAIRKFDIEEQTRRNEAATTVRAGMVTELQQQQDRAKFFKERSPIGDYSMGDSIKYAQEQAKTEASGKYTDTLRGLDISETTGEAAKKYGDAAGSVLDYQRGAALRDLLRTLDTTRIQGTRELGDRNLADRQLKLTANNELTQSSNAVQAATKDSYDQLGLTSYTREFNRKQAISEQQMSYQQGSLDIDKMVNSGQYKETDAAIIELRANLEAVNNIKLDNINKQFSDLGDVIKGIHSDTTNIFKDFILNTNNIGQSLGKILQSIFTNLDNMVSQQLSDQLFGSIFGKPDPTASANGNGIGNSPGSFGNLLGGIGAFFGIGKSNGGLGGNSGNFGKTTSNTLSSILGLGTSNSAAPDTSSFFNANGATSSLVKALSTWDTSSNGFGTAPDISGLNSIFGSSSGSADYSNFLGSGSSDDSFSLLGFASGGMVGGISRSLQKERSLSGLQPKLVVANVGERILNPQETEMWNNLQSAGMLPTYADGGMIGGVPMPVLGAGMNGAAGMSINVPINISGSDAGGINVPQLQKVMTASIQQTIKQERRPGGSLSGSRTGLYDR